MGMWVCCKDIEDLKTHHNCELGVCAKRECVSERMHDIASEQTSARQKSELTQQCDVSHDPTLLLLCFCFFFFFSEV